MENLRKFKAKAKKQHSYKKKSVVVLIIVPTYTDEVTKKDAEVLKIESDCLKQCLSHLKQMNHLITYGYNMPDNLMTRRIADVS